MLRRQIADSTSSGRDDCSCVSGLHDMPWMDGSVRFAWVRKVEFCGRGRSSSRVCVVCVGVGGRGEWICGLEEPSRMWHERECVSVLSWVLVGTCRNGRERG